MNGLFQIRKVIGCCLFLIISASDTARSEEVAPLPETAKVQEQYLPPIQTLTDRITASPKLVALYSSRGDAFFFLQNFSASVKDYDEMVTLDEEQDASHWRRGIAYFYNKDYDKAAAQFERYHSFDNVDRENGIWRYFSMRKAQGAEAARKELLRYEKDDREPFPDVYRLFAGELTPNELIALIDRPKISPQEREKRQFYGYLYLGLNEAIEGRRESAMKYLEKSVKNQWGQTAGYGPNYMWQVGRIQLELLRAEAEQTE